MLSEAVLIEELRVTEEELRAQTEELAESQVLIAAERQRYQDLFEHAPVPYLVTDPNGIIRAVNRAGASLLRCRPDRLAGKPLAAFISVRTRSTFRQQIQRVRAGGEALPVLLKVFPRVGPECVVMGTVGPVYEHGEIVELRWLIAPQTATQDMSPAFERRLEEAEQARLRAEQALRDIVELMAWASHELRTPVASIGGYSEILMLGLRGMLTPDQQAVLVRIQHAQGHLVALLDDLMTFTRAGSGRLTYTIADTALDAVIDHVLTIAEPQAAARDIRVTTRIPGGIVLRSDGERLLQILLNLVVNAIKYTPAGGAVDLSCDPEGDTVILRVRDTGVGIPEDARERIFRPYVRLDTAAAARVTGVGLGLAISRELARAMGGDLACTHAPGGGSLFILRVPRSMGIAAPVHGP